MDGKRILVVDDSPQIRDGLEELLSGAGFNVVPASDGVEGLDAAKVNSFDLIIADVNMPRLNGLDMLEEIRKVDMNADTPSFVLTTESLKKFSLRFRALGATTWIVKPYDPDLLLRSIELIFARYAKRN